MTSFRFLLFCKYCFLICFFNFFAYGEILIIQSSDQHSSYRRLPQFLRSIEILSRDFQEEYPKGQLILLINGDFSAHDNNFWIKKEKGNFGYEILSQLAQKYLVLYTFGNHDAFDWKDSRLFLDQMTKLKESGAHLLAANVSFHPDYQYLFNSFVDIPLSKNRMIRFSGFTFPYLKENLFLKKLKGPKVISDITHIKKALSEIIDEANNDSNVHALILGMHLATRQVKSIISKLGPGEKRKLNIVFAAHDHKHLFVTDGQTHIIDSGSYFDFSAIILNDRGRVVSKTFFDQASQEAIFKSKGIKEDGLESQLIQRTREYMEDISVLKRKKAALKRERRLKRRFFNNSRTMNKSLCFRTFHQSH